MEDVNYLIKHSSGKIRRPPEAGLKEPQKLIRRSPEARLKACRPCTHPDSYLQPHPWTTAIKLLTKFPWVGTQFLKGTSLLYPPLPGKSIKLFFSTSPKTLSPRFSSVQVKFSASITHTHKKTHLKLMVLVLIYVWEDARIWGHWNSSLDMLINYLGAHISKTQNASSWFSFWIIFRMYWRSVTAVAKDLICVELDGRWHSLFTVSN